jgi:hypothetical protein
MKQDFYRAAKKKTFQVRTCESYMYAPAVRVNESAAPTAGLISMATALFLVIGLANSIFTVPCFWPLIVGRGASLAEGSVKVNVDELNADEYGSCDMVPYPGWETTMIIFEISRDGAPGARPRLN